MKKWIKDNKKLFDFIKKENIKVIEIKPVYKIKHRISSYCVVYQKVI